MNNIFDLLSLRGKIALVTGGAGYLGVEISTTLAELGSDVIIASRDLEKCKVKCLEIEKRCKGEIKAFPLELNVLSKESVESAFKYIDDEFSGLDILVNNAWSGKKNSLDSITYEDWNYDIDMSLNSVFYCIKNALDGLKREKGVILNITSMYGHVAPDYRLYNDVKLTNPPSYGAAKAGVIQFTRYLASFLSPYEIRVNCLSPGPFPHPETQKNIDFMQKLSNKVPLNRIGNPSEIKGVVALLCSDASSYMTGQHISVDGGWSVW